jgi:hypothetical protein
MAAERVAQRLLAGVAERRMPDVVRQGKGFDKVRIQSQRRSHGTRNLCHFEGMREAAAKVIGKSFSGQAGEHLRLPGQAAKGAGVQNPRSVAREGRAIGVRRLWVSAAHQFAVGPAAGGNSGWQRDR